MPLPSAVEHVAPCGTLVLQRLTRTAALGPPEPRVLTFVEFSVHGVGGWEACLWLPPEELGPGTRGEGQLADGRVLHVDIDADDDMKVYLVGPVADPPFTACWSRGPLPTGARLSLCWTCSDKASWGLEISSPAVVDRDGNHGPRHTTIWCCTRHRSCLIDTLRRLISQSRYPGRRMPAEELPNGGGPEAEPMSDDAERWLGACLGRALHGTRYDFSGWMDEVRSAVYRHSTHAVALLERYWREGLLRGEPLHDALSELGHIDEPSSLPQRRALLVAVLFSSDPDVRCSAAEGLALLADPAAQGDIAAALEREQNDLVKQAIQGALDESCAADVVSPSDGG